jgi:hypothetical protein
MKLKFKLKKIKLEKHILIILGTVLFTAILSLYILSLILSTETKNTEVSNELRRLKSRLNSINRYTPTPTSSNISLINKDAEYMKLQLFELKTKLGSPYTAPLESFLKALNETKENNNSLKKDKSNVNETITKSQSDSAETTKDSEENENVITLDQFLNSWQAYYKANKPDTQDIDSAKKTFINYVESLGFTKKKYSEAFQAFRNSLQKNSYEEIDNILAEDYLLNSVGFPLRITRIQCKELISKIQTKLNSELYKNKIMSSSQTFNLFNEFTTMPNDDQIPYIINYLWFYQDLVKKVIASGIDSFPTHNKLNSLRGETKNDITILKYDIEVIGSFESVRKLINEFQSSYKNNKIYSVDFVSFKKAIDNAKNLPVPEKRKRKLNIEIIIGTSELVKANIKISYYIYNKPLIAL